MLERHPGRELPRFTYVDEGLISKQLRDNAEEVRLTGKDVAHPEEMTSITAEDAEDSLVFLNDFLETTIAIPARQAKRKERREKG